MEGILNLAGFVLILAIVLGFLALLSGLAFF